MTPNRSKSHAVLIGVGSYRHKDKFTPVSAEANLNALYNSLTGPQGCIAPENCTKILDPKYATDILEPIHQAAVKATDLLFVYYVGHGVRAPDLTFMLTCGETSDKDYFYKNSALDWDSLRLLLRNETTAKRKVVVLDCCYSGGAVGALGSEDPPALTAEGAYILASCQRDEMVWGGKPLTMFTNNLVKVLNEGVKSKDEYLTLGLIHGELYRRLRVSRNWRIPPPLVDGSMSEFALLRNPGYQLSDMSILDRWHRWQRNRANRPRKPKPPRMQTQGATPERLSAITKPADSKQDAQVPPSPNVEKSKNSARHATKGGGLAGVIAVGFIFIVANGTESSELSKLPVNGDKPTATQVDIQYELSPTKPEIHSTFDLPTGTNFRRIRTSAISVSSVGTSCKNVDFEIQILIDGKSEYSASYVSRSTGAASTTSTSLPVLERLNATVPSTAKTLEVVANINPDDGCKLVLVMSGAAVIDGDTEWLLDLR